MIALDAFRTIQFALHNKSELGKESMLAWTNEAGAILCNMHPWRWLERSTGAISLVAGQEYLDTPSDFGSLIGDPWQVAGVRNRMQPVDIDELNEIRSSGGTSNSVYAYCITYPAFSSAADPGRARIEVGPTQSTTVANAVRIFYRAEWVDAVQDTDHLDVRPFMVPLYNLILSELARGKDEADGGTVAARMEQVRASMLFRDAASRDGGIQAHSAPMRGGAIAMAQRDFDGAPYNNIRSISGP